MNKKDPDNRSSFDFCSNEVKSIKENLMCQQDSLHKSMIDNPLGFIIFYVFAIVFVALLFQLSKKDFSSKRKRK
ncbi:MAG: hypothetical protein CMM98_01295 [Rickettsiales bacterium]|nr:hypothetical protein [Rickettsiales bacterium]